MKFSNRDFITENTGKFKDNYKLVSRLGSGKLFTHNEGAFGEVYQCKHRETGAQRALKVIYKSSLDEEDSKKLINEVEILKELVRRRNHRITLIFSNSTNSSRIRNATTSSLSYAKEASYLRRSSRRPCSVRKMPSCI